jgi:hypothetical protein
MNQKLMVIASGVISIIITILIYSAAISACIECQVKITGIDPIILAVYYLLPTIIVIALYLIILGLMHISCEDTTNQPRLST